MVVDQLGQAQVRGEGGRQEQAGIGHQAVVVEGDLDPSEWLRGSILYPDFGPRQ